MKNKLIYVIFLVFIITIFTSSAPKKSYGIPPFAQKYHFTCAVCHTTFPNLNPFGRAFWRNGFRLPDTNGMAADATQITQGLSLPNPWPIPLSIAPTISYQHYTNENVNSSTDSFSGLVMFDAGGEFKLYTPFAQSLSFFSMNNIPTGGNFTEIQLWASLNGLGHGFGVSSHLLNLKIGQVNTAAAYFDKQVPFYLIAPGANATGPDSNIQGLNVGYDGEGDNLINAMMGSGIELYGTPGYHLWYKLTVTNDAGMPNMKTLMAYPSEADSNISAKSQVSNAMEYSYQLKEYYPTSMGQLEFGYYGSIIAEPIYVSPMNNMSGGSWTNRIVDNGVDIDIANDIYELGITYMVQSDNHPYGNPSMSPTNLTLNGTAVGNTNSSNGYSTFEVYGRYLFPQIGNGLMLSAEYAQYSWTHKDLQEGFNQTFGGVSTSCQSNSGLYQQGVYTPNSSSCSNEGIKDNLDLLAEYSLAYNAHLYLEYLITNKSQDDTIGTGLAFGF